MNSVITTDKYEKKMEKALAMAINHEPLQIDESNVDLAEDNVTDRFSSKLLTNNNAVLSETKRQQ